MAFKSYHQNLASSLSFLSQKYFHIFHWYAKSSANELLLMFLIYHACMDLKLKKASQNFTH